MHKCIFDSHVMKYIQRTHESFSRDIYELFFIDFFAKFLKWNAEKYRIEFFFFFLVLYFILELMTYSIENAFEYLLR